MLAQHLTLGNALVKYGNDLQAHDEIDMAMAGWSCKCCCWTHQLVFPRLFLVAHLHNSKKCFFVCLDIGERNLFSCHSSATSHMSEVPFCWVTEGTLCWAMERSGWQIDFNTEAGLTSITKGVKWNPETQWLVTIQRGNVRTTVRKREGFADKIFKRRTKERF